MALSLNRRDCLKFGGVAIALSSFPVRRGLAQAGEKGLIVRTEQPFNAEPPVEKLVDHWITPTSGFFVRNHGNIPNLNADGFQLSIEGMAERPVKLGLKELLEKFPATSLTATVTCAGNRRTEFNRVKKVGGVQWDAGAIGNAEWSGVRLSDLLKHVGLKPEVKHIWFEGQDQITEKGETFPFGGSIPLDKAMSDRAGIPGCLLATAMNGQPLTKEHGFPLRGVVPGFIGARSVKWLSKITLSDRPSPNHYLAHAYKVIAEDTPAAVDAAEPIYEFMLNSIICGPNAGAIKTGDRITIRGVALPSGRVGARVKQVELSTDSGKSWAAAQWTSPIRDFCWAHWSVDLVIPPNAESILVRAAGADGEVQPKETPWNVKGYQYNGWFKLALGRT